MRHSNPKHYIPGNPEAAYVSAIETLEDEIETSRKKLQRTNLRLEQLQDEPKAINTAFALIVLTGILGGLAVGTLLVTTGWFAGSLVGILCIWLVCGVLGGLALQQLAPSIIDILVLILEDQARKLENGISLRVDALTGLDAGLQLTKSMPSWTPVPDFLKKSATGSFNFGPAAESPEESSGRAACEARHALADQSTSVLGF